MKILALVNFYLPGYKGGGPIQSVANMAAFLGENFRFQVITTDRDHRDSTPYPGVRPGEWQEVGRARVLYVAPGDLSLSQLRRILNNTEYDVLYLNSFFHPQFTIQPLLLRWAGIVRRTPIVVAPRGEFSPGALRIKCLKKRLYLAAVKMLGLYNEVIWHASSHDEEAQIRNCFGCGAIIGRAPIIVAPDMVSLPGPMCRVGVKERGRLRIVFVSRISPKKNLTGALRCLNGLRGAIEFDICGHVDNEAYWEECQKIIHGLPSNINVRYLGSIPHDQLTQEIAHHDLFFLPTFGENFGHVIVEALWAGCPVLISDQTPWRDLESKHAGWDLPAEQVSSFQDVVQRCIDMDDQEHQRWRDGAQRLAEAVVHDDAAVGKNQDLFVQAIRHGLPSGRKRERKPSGSFTDECRSHFEGMADLWETKYKPGGSLQQRAISIIRCLQESVDASGEVLDFGCGSGDIAIACGKAGYRMSGIDLSPAMIARARLRPNGRGIGFDVLESDQPLTLPYPEACFDAVIASSVLEYVNDPLDCFKELWRVCKPDGVLIATVPNLSHPRRWLEVTLRHPLIRKRFAAKSRWRRYGEYLGISRNRFRRKHWLNLLRLAGWQLKTVRARSTSLVMLVAGRAGKGQVHSERHSLPYPAGVLQAQK